MKKRCLLAVMLAFVVLLSGCGGQPATQEVVSEETSSVAETVSSETVSEETVSEETVSEITSSGEVSSEEATVSSEEEEPEVEYESVNPGDTIITDFAEIKLDTNVYESKTITVPEWIQSEQDNSAPGEWEVEDEKKTFVYITGSIKNVGESKYDMYLDNTKVRLTFDDKYNYDGNIAEVKLGTSGYGSYKIDVYELYGLGPSIEPFETKYFMLYANIPDELINSYKTCTFDFGFDDNFETSYTPVEERENRYRINIEK